MRIHAHTRALGALALGLVLAAGLAACGSDDDATRSAGTSATEHDDGDVAFASDMIQHHAQALAMVDLTLDRPLDPEVQRLAEGIRDAQAPEIETMADWLTGWGEEVPATVRDHVHAGHDSGDTDGMEGMGGTDGAGDAPGMMTADDMDALANASDEEFQDMWLAMMVEHHEGAIDMAEEEQAAGRFGDAVDLAGRIIDTQSREVDAMEELLGS